MPTSTYNGIIGRTFFLLNQFKTHNRTRPESPLMAPPTDDGDLNTQLPTACSRLEVRRTFSPYDLTAMDNPVVIISNPLLWEHTYDEWACSIKTSLISRKKFGFFDETIPKLTET